MKNINYFTHTMIFLFVFTSIHSQTITKTAAQIKFQSSLQAGSLYGQSGSKPALTISTINGIKIKQWFTGIGVGIDYYGAKRTIPLFAAVQKDLSKKVNSFFLYGNAGYNFAWLKEQEKMNWIINYKQKGGLFYDAGMGYKLKIFHNNYIGFSAGYSFKQVKEKYGYPPCIACGEDIAIPPFQEDRYTFRRVAIKFNWWFL